MKLCGPLSGRRWHIPVTAHLASVAGVTPSIDVYERPERRLITCGWLAMSDLEVDETRLEMAQRHVRETEKRIALQAALIRRMERNGEDVLAEIGRNLLEDLRQSLHEARDHVERLKDLQH
jgi:hypothetical protein